LQLVPFTTRRPSTFEISRNSFCGSVPEIDIHVFTFFPITSSFTCTLGQPHSPHHEFNTVSPLPRPNRIATTLLYQASHKLGELAGHIFMAYVQGYPAVYPHMLTVRSARNLLQNHLATPHLHKPSDRHIFLIVEAYTSQQK
jgi:hypothetical protein